MLGLLVADEVMGRSPMQRNLARFQDCTTNAPILLAVLTAGLGIWPSATPRALAGSSLLRRASA